MKSFIICTVTKYHSGEQIKKNEMGGTCSTYGDRRCAYRVWWVDLREREHLQDLGVDGRILKKWNGQASTRLIWLRIVQVAGAYECGNEPSGCIKREEFLDQLRTC
jgi:hypothetical protein